MTGDVPRDMQGTGRRGGQQGGTVAVVSDG